MHLPYASPQGPVGRSVDVHTRTVFEPPNRPIHLLPLRWRDAQMYRRGFRDLSDENRFGPDPLARGTETCPRLHGPPRTPQHRVRSLARATGRGRYPSHRTRPLKHPRRAKPGWSILSVHSRTSSPILRAMITFMISLVPA